jgi:hypothetical protein
MVTRQVYSSGTDKGTWDGGCTKGRTIAARHLADEDYAGYYAILADYKDLNSRTSSAYYAGFIDGCRAALRDYRAVLGQRAAA